MISYSNDDSIIHELDSNGNLVLEIDLGDPALSYTLWRETLYGPPPHAPRTPTVGFTVRSHTSEDVCRHLAARGLFLSHGDFYATTVVERLGVEGLVRAGCACYTSAEEVDRLIEGVRAL